MSALPKPVTVYIARLDGRELHELVAYDQGLTIWDVSPPGYDIHPNAWCTRNGLEVPRDVWERLRVSPGDELAFGQRPEFESAFAISLATSLVTSAVSFLISHILRAGKQQTDPDDQSSSTYGYRNLQANGEAANAPIPVVYGEHRVAPPRIAQRTISRFDGNGNPYSELWSLYVISEGPIKAIGDKEEAGGPFSLEFGNELRTLQIENQPAENLEGVESYVRLGGLDQTVIPGFESDFQTFGVETRLTDSDAAPDPTSLELVPGIYGPSDPGILAWDTAVSYTMGEAADSFSAVVTFPRGLFSVSGSGVLNQRTARFQTRIRAVDDFGSPLGDYLVYPVEAGVTAARQGEFPVAFQHDFLDPAEAYTGPVKGGYILARATATGDGAMEVTGDVPSPTAEGAEFTFMGWVDGAAGFTTRGLFSWFDAGAFKGMAVTLISDGSGGWTLRTTIGDGTGFNNIDVTGFGISGIINTKLVGPASLWSHIAITFKGSINSNGDSRLRVYVNGLLEVERTTQQHKMLFPIDESTGVVQVMRIGNDGQGNRFDGKMDECAFYRREVPSFEIQTRWNQGAGVPHVGTELGLMQGCRFNSTTATFGITYALPMFGPNAASLGCSIGADPLNPTTDYAFFSTGGHVPLPVEGTLKKGRYLIQIQRISADDGETSINIEDESVWQEIEFATHGDKTYPELALLAVRIPRTDQLNTTRPLTTVIAKGRFVPVWDGVDEQNPTALEEYSQNPAWISADIATNRRYGLGAYELTGLNLAKYLEAADYYDDQVPDGQTTLPIVAVRKDDSAGAGPGYPNGSVSYFVDATALPLPDNFPGVTGGVTATGAMLRAAYTGSGTTLAWLDVELALGSSEVQEVVHLPNTSPPFIEFRVHALGTDSSESTTGLSGSYTLGRYETRCQFDGVFDRVNFSGWEAIKQVLETAMSAPVQESGRLSIYVNREREPTGFFGMGAIKRGSWAMTRSSRANRANLISTEIYDRGRNYERDPVEDEHPSLNDPSGSRTVIAERLRSEGIVRRTQARRNLRVRLNQEQNLLREGSFKTGLAGTGISLGQRLIVSHDAPNFGWSGRVWATSANLTTLRLDREVTLAAATTYQVLVESVASGAKSTRTITTAAGTYVAGSTLTVSPAFDFTPNKDDQYCVAIISANGPGFDVLVAGITPDLQAWDFKIDWLEYRADTYEIALDTEPTEVSTQEQPPSEDAVPEGVLGLTVFEENQIGSSGAPQIVAALSWRHPTASYYAVSGSNIFVAPDTGGAGLPQAELIVTVPRGTTTYRITSFPFRRDVPYRVYVQPFKSTRDGSLSRRTGSALFVPEGTTQAGGRVPLEVSGKLTAQFLIFVWQEFTSGLTGGATPGAEPIAGSIVEARAGGWILGTYLGEAPSAAKELRVAPFTIGTNAAGIEGAEFHLRSRLADGQYSEREKVTGDDALVIGTTALMDVDYEDAGFGALENIVALQVNVASNAAPVREQGFFLEFNGSALVASFEVATPVFADAQDVYPILLVEAHQIHPTAMEDIPAHAFARWTFEGPSYTLPGDTPNTTLGIGMLHTVKATPIASLGALEIPVYEPGLYHMRSARFRVTITRPSDDYQIRIHRVSLRVIKRNVPTVDQLAGAVFSL